jgi:hypothetical protein
MSGIKAGVFANDNYGSPGASPNPWDMGILDSPPTGSLILDAHLECVIPQPAQRTSSALDRELVAYKKYMTGVVTEYKQTLTQNPSLDHNLQDCAPHIVTAVYGIGGNIFLEERVGDYTARMSGRYTVSADQREKDANLTRNLLHFFKVNMDSHRGYALQGLLGIAVLALGTPHFDIFLSEFASDGYAGPLVCSAMNEHMKELLLRSCEAEEATRRSAQGLGLLSNFSGPPFK